jgi:hypothetical protein
MPVSNQSCTCSSTKSSKQGQLGGKRKGMEKGTSHVVCARGHCTKQVQGEANSLGEATSLGTWRSLDSLACTVSWFECKTSQTNKAGQVKGQIAVQANEANQTNEATHDRNCFTMLWKWKDDHVHKGIR